MEDRWWTGGELIEDGWRMHEGYTWDGGCMGHGGWKEDIW